ncbi:hypothetical protein [Geomicrobium sp. JCM 19038]|uniref:hypothetical protein n=1 Tax=Geomicrobium sp. JCM 19038 TaxID=1460635 RepID=UPI0005A6A458|nr:hypothetical protein [Geomicrobium sp. JCM 19038]
MKRFFIPVVTFAFLGYLWFLFATSTVDLVNASSFPIILGILALIVGSLLFFYIMSRLKPVSELLLMHPVRLSSYGTFICIVMMCAMFI